MKKFKRAFSTLTCMNADIDEIIAHANKASIKYLEVRLDPDENLCGLGIEKADEIKAKFENAGCTVLDLATAVSLADKNDVMLKKAKKCIDFASALGAKGIRIFVGAHMKTFSDVPNQSLDGIAETLMEMCAYAKEKGVEIWAETHSALSTAKSICELCDMVGVDNLKVLWDVIHSMEFQEPVEESVKIMGDRLVHVHLKDGVPQEDKTLTQYRHTALGKGAVPLAKVLKLLEGAGYDGCLSLEWELPWRPELKDCYADADATLAAYNRWLDEASAE